MHGAAYVRKGKWKETRAFHLSNSETRAGPCLPWCFHSSKLAFYSTSNLLFGMLPLHDEVPAVAPVATCSHYHGTVTWRRRHCCQRLPPQKLQPARGCGRGASSPCAGGRECLPLPRPPQELRQAQFHYLGVDVVHFLCTL